MPRLRTFAVSFLAVLTLLTPLNVFGQTRPGTLLVTVVDPSNAVIAKAAVTVSGMEGATKGVVRPPIETTGQGIATVADLPPGSYSVKAEFAGFQTKTMVDVRVRSGENKLTIPLAIEAFADSVTAGEDKQAAAADRATSFGTTLTREAIAALSDDPDELRRQLQEMAGPGAVISVDSFEGAALPAKAQIRSIRISRDQFAAENHSAGGTSVEILTQPGLGPVRYYSNFRLRDGSMSGRSPFTPTKGSEQIRGYNFGSSGTLIPNKSSFNLNINGTDSYDTPSINAALAGGGSRSEIARLRTPRDNLFVNANVDYALTVDQTLRFGYNMSRVTASNLGIGDYDDEGRAYSTENTSHAIRGQHMGPLGRRMFTRTRLQFNWNDSSSRSGLEAPTIRVLEAFTTGGAQVAGGQHTRFVSFGSDLDYVRGLHTFRAGITLDGGSVRADDTSNYLGTYTFESLDAYLENRPRSYTRRVGSADIGYRNLQTGLYLQDDIKVRKNLTVSGGVRYEAQTHLRDYDNFMPRVGFTWAPFASGATTIRSSWGLFYDWLPLNTYEQTLRVDGFHQQELNIVNPTYPDLAEGGTTPPINRYFLSSDLPMPKTSRVSLGVDQRLSRAFQLSSVFAYQRGGSLYRGLNINAPLDGARPDPTFGNVIQVVADAESRQKQLQLNLTVNPGALLPAFNAPRIGWKRITSFVNYTVSDARNNTDGAFNVAPTGDLGLEWGAANTDVRHRFNLQLNNQVVRNLLMAFNVNVSSGLPYTLRTGFDENGDLIFNDRPEGVVRNTERAATQWTINQAFAYTFTFGRRASSLPPGIAVIAGTVRNFDEGNARYRLQFVVQINNLTNRPNYAGYSGTMTSPFFRRPTSVSGMRKVDVGVSLQF